MARDKSLRNFDQDKIISLSRLSDLRLHHPESDEWLADRANWPAFQHSVNPVFSIIIPTHNHVGYLFNCLQSLKTSCQAYDGKYEVIVVDDASKDQTSTLLEAVGVKKLPLRRNAGYVKASNLGATLSRGRFLILLNNDVIVCRDWMRYIEETFQTVENTGAVGSKLLYPSGVLQEAGSIVWKDGTAWNYGKMDHPDVSDYNYVRDVDYCSAASLAVARDSVRGTLFDTRFHPGYYEDADLCFRIRNMGRRVLYQPRSVVIHFEGTSHGRDVRDGVKRFQAVNRRKFVRKWKRKLTSHYPSEAANVLKARSSGAGRQILVLDHQVPRFDENSGDLRMYSILKILRSSGHAVTFLPPLGQCDGDYAERLRQCGVEMICDLYALEELLVRRPDFYDVIFISRTAIAKKYINCCRLFSPKSILVVDFPDLESVRRARYAELIRDNQERIEAAQMAREELQVARMADRAVTITDVERRVLLARDRSLRIDVVPNVHQVSRNDVPFEERQNLLFVGGYEHPPNVDAVSVLVKKILPLIRPHLPNAKLLLVGSKMPDNIRNLKYPGVEIVGYVHDLNPILDSCRVFVAPLRYGAGLKGKIGTALAAGLPVVTTRIGAEGIALKQNVVLVANDYKQFAEATVRLYTHPKLWKTMAINGKAFVRRNYAPAIATKLLKRLMAEWIATSPRALSSTSVEQLAGKMGQDDPLASLLSIYYARPDLQAVFPEVRSGDYGGLVNWASTTDDKHQALLKYREWYCEAARLHRYERSAGEDPLSALLFTYHNRPDLQKAYPEVKQGEYGRLVEWAAKYSQADNMSERLAPHLSWYATDATSEIEARRARQENAKLSERMDSMQSELSRSQLELDTIRQENTSLRSELSSVRLEKQKVQKEIETAQSELEKLQHELEEIRSSFGHRAMALLHNIINSFR
jgi:GT2 family glycosyltransferase